MPLTIHSSPLFPYHVEITEVYTWEIQRECFCSVRALHMNKEIFPVICVPRLPIASSGGHNAPDLALGEAAVTSSLPQELFT